MEKEVTFNGVVYRLMGTGKYYLSQSTSNAGRRAAKGLHVAIWEHFSGKKVPRGHVVHHRDGNPHNNDFSNLECISRKEHAARHPEMPAGQLEHLERIRPLASKWHRSAEGREWHRAHASKPHQERKATCAYCQKTFTTRGYQTKFCRPQCGYKSRLADGYYRVTVTCVTCGKSFETNKPINPKRLTKTCSPQCRARLSWGETGQTQCIHGHPLSGENVFIRRNGSRGCKTCRSISGKRCWQKSGAEKLRLRRLKRKSQQNLAKS